MNLREYLVDNMFDGDEGGELTMNIKDLLDQIEQNLALWFVDITNTADFVGQYLEGG